MVTTVHQCSRRSLLSQIRTLCHCRYEKNLTSELVKFVAVDLRPYSSVSGSGFQSLCQTLVNYGAQYVNFNVKKALPDRKTVARHVPDVAAATKAEGKNKLAKSDYIALTTDGWTNDFRKVAYVTVTAHYFDSDLNLQSCILNTGAVNEKKTAEVLCNVVKEVAVDFGIEMNKVTIVTDNAANMIAAFRDQCCRLSCFAHCLNLVVNDIIAVDNAEFQALMTGCKNLVRHFKHTGLQRQLTKTLKQECPTRWNSTYLMLESVLEQYDMIHDILKERSELRFLYAVDQDILKEVTAFLTHFKSASELACCDRKPTLHMVAPLHHRLLSTACAESPNDSAVIWEMKSKGRAVLASKVRLDVRHDAAAFLNPCMKGLCFIPPARKRMAMETINKLLAELDDDSSSQTPASAARDASEVSLINCSVYTGYSCESDYIVAILCSRKTLM